jgi:hypothetical protein
MTQGPSHYTTGTERALFTFCDKTCYFPGCTERVIVFVNDEPVSSAQIAHIRGARPGSARYDANMTDNERRAFANLILLCTAHHAYVDRLHPERYPAELLAQWKRDREQAAGIDGTALAGVTDDRLAELIEAAVRNLAPQRRLLVEVGIGFVRAAPLEMTFVTLPSATAREFLPMYTELGPAGIILSVRNQGTLESWVSNHALRLLPSGAPIIFPNEYPAVSPALPHRLGIGESAQWLYSLGWVERLTGFLQAQGQTITEVVGEVSLGSGETLRSDPLAVELINPAFARPGAGE